MRNFQFFDRGTAYGGVIKAEQISSEGNAVGFYAAAVEGNSRKLLAYVLLAPGQSIREVESEQ